MVEERGGACFNNDVCLCSHWADLTIVALATAEMQTSYTVLSNVFYLCTGLRFKMLGKMNAAFTC